MLVEKIICDLHLLTYLSVEGYMFLVSDHDAQYVFDIQTLLPFSPSSLLMRQDTPDTKLVSAL